MAGLWQQLSESVPTSGLSGSTVLKAAATSAARQLYQQRYFQRPDSQQASCVGELLNNESIHVLSE